MLSPNVFHSKRDFIELYCPDFYAHSILDIDYDTVKKNGVKYISFDVDDTICGLETTLVPDEMRALFYKLSENFEIFILSHTPEFRMRNILRQLPESVVCIDRFWKPNVEGFLVNHLYSGAEDTGEFLHIGNLITTDVYGANRIGMYSALVDDCGWLSKVTRKFYPRNYVEHIQERKIRKELTAMGWWIKGHYFPSGNATLQDEKDK